MRSNDCCVGHSPGTTRCSTRTPGSPAVLDRADATASGIASQASRRVAAGREPRGEHPDRAAGLECGAVAFPRQQGDGERVLARLVPAVGQPVRIG